MSTSPTKAYRFQKAYPYLIKMILLCFVGGMAIGFCDTFFSAFISILTFLITLVLDGYFINKRIRKLDNMEKLSVFQLICILFFLVALLASITAVIIFATHSQTQISFAIRLVFVVMIILMAIASVIPEVLISGLEED